MIKELKLTVKADCYFEEVLDLLKIIDNEIGLPETEIVIDNARDYIELTVASKRKDGNE